MRHRFARPTPSFVISAIALFVALGGTSYAVATGSIDSREIKNNSVRGTDIKNSTVQGKDIKNGTIKQGDISDTTEAALKGQTGPQGQKGAQGMQGPRGIVTPQYGTNGSVNIIAGAVAGNVIVTKVVPAGTYVVHAKTSLFSVLGARNIQCNLSNGNTVVDTISWDSTIANDNSPVSLPAATTVTTGPLLVRCFHNGADMTPGGSATDTKLVAIPVG